MTKTIRNKINIAIVAALVLLLTLSLAPAWTQDAHAASNAQLTVRQEFTVSNAGNNNISTTGTYKLSAKSANAPMPEGYAGKSTYSFSISGNNESTLNLVPTSTGTFEYTLRQTSSFDNDNGKYTVDDSVYTVKVYVTGSAGNYSCQVIVLDSVGEKPDEICYRNSYAGATVKPGDKSANETIVDKVSKIIKTGDPVQITLIAATILASLGALILILLLRKKRKAEEAPAGQAGQV